jgi:hypothetical protein
LKRSKREEIPRLLEEFEVESTLSVPESASADTFHKEIGFVGPMGKEKDAPQRRQRHTHLLAQRLARPLEKALRCYRRRVSRFRNSTPWLNGIRMDLSESYLGIHSSKNMTPRLKVIWAFIRLKRKTLTTLS